jgi:hypothetical protein
MLGGLGGMGFRAPVPCRGFRLPAPVASPASPEFLAFLASLRRSALPALPVLTVLTVRPAGVALSGPSAP